MDNTIYLEEDNCPYCGAIFNAVSSINTNVPKPEDVSICTDCGNIFQFGDGMKPQKATEETLQSLNKQEVKEVRERIKELKWQGELK